MRDDASLPLYRTQASARGREYGRAASRSQDFGGWDGIRDTKSEGLPAALPGCKPLTESPTVSSATGKSPQFIPSSKRTGEYF